MSKVRLLFAPENTGFADKLASALAESGYDASTEDDPSAAALVVWSQASAVSKPILSAARSALARRALVPVALGKTPPPPSFEHLWPMDLAGWNGRPDDPRWKFVLDELDLATRRGVLLRPAAANDRGEPAQKYDAAQVSDAPAAASAAAEPTLYAEERVETIRPRPNFPRIAIGGAIMLAALAGAGAAALLIGLSDGRRAAAARSAPVVSFVVPPQPEAVAVPVTGAAPPAEPDPLIPAGPQTAEEAAPAGLREGEAAPGETEALTTDDAAAAAAPAPAAAEQAEAATETNSAPGADDIAEAPAAGPTAAPPAEEGADPIAGLAFKATATDPSATATATPGRYLRDCLDCPDLAEIDAGSFLMGAIPGDARAEDFEGPQTPVTVTRPLAMSVRETSRDDWRLCVADGACPARGGPGKQPVAVSHAEAEAYAAWLSAKTGRLYRLPSEAEWEYVAGARADNEPVNAFGVYGLLAGVREWTADCWRPGHAERPGDAGVVGGACQMRVVKGVDNGRPAARGGAIAGSESAAAFRVVRDLY